MDFTDINPVTAIGVTFAIGYAVYRAWNPDENDEGKNEDGPVYKPMNIKSKNDKNMKEIIKEYLQKEGCNPQVDEEGDLLFKYQGGTFILHGYDSNDGYLKISMPQIYEVPDDMRIQAFEAANHTSLMFKVAKTLVCGKYVWIMFEQLEYTGEKVDEFVPLVLDILFSSRQEFYEYLEKTAEQEEKES